MAEQDASAVADLLWQAQTALVKHAYARAVVFLEEAAALNSGEACLNLGNICASHNHHHSHNDALHPPNHLEAAQWYIRGLECELKRACNPFEGDGNGEIDLGVTAPLSHALAALYRRGKVGGIEKNGERQKNKHENVWAHGARVSLQILHNSTVLEKSEDYSREALRKSVYIANAYIQALVEFAPLEDATDADAKTRALDWWQKIVDLAGSSRSSGSRETDVLVEKAKQRIQLVHKAASTPTSSEGSNSPELRTHSWSLNKPSPTAVFDIGSPTVEETPIHAPRLQPITDSPLHRLPPAAKKVPPPPSESRRSKRQSKFTFGSDGPLSPTSEHSSDVSDPSEKPDTTKDFFSIKKQPKPAKEAKQATRPHPLLRGSSGLVPRINTKQNLFPSHASSASLYLSQELIGIPASSLRSRASSASMMSLADSMIGDFSQARVLSSASLASLPHVNPVLSNSTNGKGHARKGSGLRNMLMMRSLSRSTGSASGETTPLLAKAEVANTGSNSDAVDVLHSLLVNHHLAEDDLRYWQEEYESDRQSVAHSRSSTVDGSGRLETASPTYDVAASPPMLRVQRASVVPSALPISGLPIASPDSGGLSPMSPRTPRQRLSVLKKRKVALMDPVLAALEQSSAINTKAECSVCHVRGINFPACRKCARVYCSRECRTNKKGGCDHRRQVEIV